MAKVGFWLQGATGKLAGSKLQKGVNGTVIANNMNKPKNPKTVNQTLQRVLLNTVAQGYSAMRPICFHAFEGVEQGAKSMAQFQSLNLKYFRDKAAEVGEEQLGAYVNFVPVGQKGIRPAAFIIADGKLPRVGMSINASFQAVLPLTANTYADIISKYDLQRGDQLTFVAIVENTEFAGTYEAKYARIILDPRNSDGTEAALSSAFIDGNSINLPNSKNDGNFGLLTYSDGMVFNFKANEKVCAVACIVSREVNKEWKRSFAQMVVSEDAIAGQSISLSRAIRLSLDGSSIRLSSGEQYLDNAGVSGGQSTDSGSGESEQEQEATPVFSGVSINRTVVDVSGGSVSVNAPITTMNVGGQNLEATSLVVEVDDAAVGELSVNEPKTDITWTGNVVADKVIKVYKNVGGTKTLWFNVNATSAGGNGGDGGDDGDDASES